MSVSAPTRSTSEPKGTIATWCAPEVNSFEFLHGETTAMRTTYDHDVRQIRGIFEKQRIMGTPSGSPTDYTISIDTLRDTSNHIFELIQKIEVKLKAYRTTCTNILFNLDTMTERVYKYARNSSAGAGLAGVGARLSLGNQTSSCSTNSSDNTSSSGSYLSPIGWVGFGLVVGALLITCVKDHIEKIKKEEKEFKGLLDENNRMHAAHEASIAMLTSLQEKYNESIKAYLDPRAHAEDLTTKFEAHLDKHITQQGMEIPPYLLQACRPGAIQRAMLRRAPILPTAQSFLVRTPLSDLSETSRSLDLSHYPMQQINEEEADQNAGPSSVKSAPRVKLEPIQLSHLGGMNFV